MTLILNIETSSDVCSAALGKDGQVIDFQEITHGRNHAAMLAVLVHDMMQRNSLDFRQLSAVAVSSGPGSYTGLRIGVSLSKGICMAVGIPLIAVSPLKALAWYISNMRSELLPASSAMYPTRLCPMLDARRMEVYMAMYDCELNTLEDVTAKIITPDSFTDIANTHQLLLFGDGADKLDDTVNHPNVKIIAGVKTSARFMCALSEAAFNEQRFEDVAYYEPLYLKDFMASKPKKLL
ncbi:MAG: tRNA (adenosine(37)-N6)-threonylcarbamoyltransferase complex dimerization subunit type 1 TsaB [Bacteroidales bacterium]|jgi:tRNA threonylcarbamoyladenosine biosynthesis protein TsaB|nr:tRNA (adenosine(37)-N6)-threonylcarbamoyltransferase complex dimerization subunit type 1 TsaB [Bacteroidales bacterium]